MFEALKLKIEERYPDVKIRYKSDHWYWKMLSRKLRFSGMGFGSTIWLPSRQNDVGMLAHEYGHIVDMKRMGMLGFLHMYCSPQIYALPLALLTILVCCLDLPVLGILLAITSIGFLLPFPSKERVALELRGYRLTLAVEQWMSDSNTPYLKKFIVDSLLSWLYYKMIWSRNEATRMVEKMAVSISTDHEILVENPAFEDTYSIFHTEKTNDE